MPLRAELAAVRAVLYCEEIEVKAGDVEFR